MPAVTGSLTAPPPALLSTHTCPRCSLVFVSAFDCAVHYLSCSGEAHDVANDVTCTALEAHLPRLAFDAGDAGDMLCPSEAGIDWGTAFDCIRTTAAPTPACDLPPRAVHWTEQGGAA